MSCIAKALSLEWKSKSGIRDGRTIILHRCRADPGNRESQLRTDGADAQTAKPLNCPAQGLDGVRARRPPPCHSCHWELFAHDTLALPPGANLGDESPGPSSSESLVVSCARRSDMP